jgi:hypothetical protein
MITSALQRSMSKATRLIKKLDKLLNRYDSFGEEPDLFVDDLLSRLDERIQDLQASQKAALWKTIYVERDRARVKQEVLNRVMARSSQ